MVSSDPQESKVKREIVVFTVLKVVMDLKETRVLLAHPVPLVPLGLLVYRVELDLKVLKDHQVQLVQREKVVFLAHRVLQVPRVRSSNHCQCSPPREPSVISMPARWWMKGMQIIITWTMRTAWRKSLVLSTH